jgi:hypothetical protein
LDGVAVIMCFIILIFLKDDCTHESAGCAAASEKLKLGKALLREDVETIQCYPASVGQSPNLFHEGCIQGFIGQLKNELVSEIPISMSGAEKDKICRG